MVPKSANPDRMKTNLEVRPETKTRIALIAIDKQADSVCLQIFELEQADFEALSQVHTEPGKLRHLQMYGQSEDIMKSGLVFDWTLEQLGWEKMD